jgi:hypothetical protein
MTVNPEIVTLSEVARSLEPRQTKRGIATCRGRAQKHAAQQEVIN